MGEQKKGSARERCDICHADKTSLPPLISHTPTPDANPSLRGPRRPKQLPPDPPSRKLCVCPGGRRRERFLHRYAYGDRIDQGDRYEGRGIFGRAILALVSP